MSISTTVSVNEKCPAQDWKQNFLHEQKRAALLEARLELAERELKLCHCAGGATLTGNPEKDMTKKIKSSEPSLQKTDLENLQRQLEEQQSEISSSKVLIDGLREQLHEALGDLARLGEKEKEAVHKNEELQKDLQVFIKALKIRNAQHQISKKNIEKKSDQVKALEKKVERFEKILAKQHEEAGTASLKLFKDLQQIALHLNVEECFEEIIENDRKGIYTDEWMLATIFVRKIRDAML